MTRVVSRGWGEGKELRFRVLRKNASRRQRPRRLNARFGQKAREPYVPPPDRQWRRRPLCVGRLTPPRRACARDGLLTYDRLLGHGLLRRPFRPPLADLFRHLVVKTTAARTMMLKMEKNYPNANSCLMFTFSVVVLHWLDGGRRWLLARRAEPTVPAAADSARRATGAEVRSIDRCARPAAVA